MTIGFVAAGAGLLIAVVTLPLAAASLRRRRRKQARRAAWRARQVERELYHRHV